MNNISERSQNKSRINRPKTKSNGWGVVEGSRILRERNVCKIPMEGFRLVEVEKSL